MREFHGDSADESPFAKLSDRELQTAIMISRGERVGDIAEAFSVSPKTVNSYRYRVFEKLDVRNDVGLTRLAIKHGIIDAEAA